MIAGNWSRYAKQLSEIFSVNLENKDDYEDIKFSVPENLTPNLLQNLIVKKIKKIISNNIFKSLREDDVSETYLNWLHDKEINQFLS